VDEAAVGCFVNLLVLRTSLADNPDFRELVDRIRTTNLQAAEHGGMPFDVLVRELAAGGSKAHHPLATVGIGLQNLPSAFPAPDGVTATILPDNPEVSRFDMNVDVFLGSDDPSSAFQLVIGDACNRAVQGDRGFPVDQRSCRARLLTFPELSRIFKRRRLHLSYSRWHDYTQRFRGHWTVHD